MRGPPVPGPGDEPAGDLLHDAGHGRDRWLREGLRYAPTAALAAVVAPELVMTQGHLIDTWRDPRLFGALAGLAFYAWRRSLFGTIVCGTGVMLALRFGLGW
jgi:branched-subunit amino acid transport protein